MKGAIRVSHENFGNYGELLGWLAGTGRCNPPRTDEHSTFAVLILRFHSRISS